MDIQEIKQQNDIVRVVGQYVSLTKRGSKWVGLCPFHDDHHPSLTVDKNKQAFACYACGERGDVIAFVQKMERCPFAEAVSRLVGMAQMDSCAGERAQMDICASAVNSGAGGPDHTEMLRKLMPYVCDVAELRDTYLVFGVGEAPHLLPAAWKYLAGRLVFPLYDGDGVLRGFSGRAMYDTGGAKYCNTSAAQGYNRNTFLYGLNRAKEAIRRGGTVYLAEGYKDVIAMHAAGFTATVGVCGTVLTGGQIGLIAGLAGRAVLLSDGDRPGQEAAVKWRGQLEEQGIGVITVSLPDNCDPDSLFRQWGKEPFAAWVTAQVHAPHATEDMLLYTLLLYPDSFTVVNGEKRRYVDMVPELLETEQLPLERAAGYTLLQHLAGGGTAANLPPHLQEICREIGDKRDGAFRHLLALLTDAPGLAPEEVPHRLAQGVLYLYLDTRLKEIIRDLVRDLQYERNEALRTQLCHALAYRREQQQSIAHLLEYPPAIAGRYR